jgi:hypothetical protein
VKINGNTSPFAQIRKETSSDIGIPFPNQMWDCAQLRAKIKLIILCVNLMSSASCVKLAVGHVEPQRFLPPHVAARANCCASAPLIPRLASLVL